MLTSSCLLFLIGFMLWMNTSKRIGWTNKPNLLMQMQRIRISKPLAIASFILGTFLCIQALGVGSGLFAAVVILMCVGGLCVLFFPFSWIRLSYIAVLYVVCLLFEQL